MIKFSQKSLFFFIFISQFLIAQTPPVANDDSIIVEINSTLNQEAPGVLSNDTDAEGDTVTVVSFLINGVTFNAGQTANFAEGTILVLEDGGYVFTPNQDFIGSISTINYTITDGSSTSSANLNISVEQVPVANDDEKIVLINSILSEPAPGILSNDSDADGDTITVTSFLINDVTFNAGQTASFTEGIILISANGSYIFTPNQNFTGNVSIVNYTITDGTFTSSANLNISVKEPPVSNDDEKIALINSTLNEPAPGVLGNDTDPDGDMLSVATFSLNEASFIAGQTTNLTEGAISISADGSYIFSPSQGFTGNVPTINYTITDGAFTSSANLNITVKQAPVANNDIVSTIQNITLDEAVPGVLINDSDADGDALTVTGFTINGVAYNAGETANFTEGSIIILSDGSYSFVPSLNYTGNVQAISYTISDGAFTSSANLIISVFLPPEPPVARNDYDTVDINTTLTVPAPGVFINDTDINTQDVLTVTEFMVNGITYNVGQTANLAQGSLTILPDGSYVFVPTPNYIGEVPNINYTITDGIFTSSANLLLTVEPTEDLLEINNFGSCNQGFNANGEYKIVYSFQLTNRNNARDLHEPALLRNIDLIDNLQNAFGNGCVINVEQVSVRNDAVENIAEGTFFPREFDTDAVNPQFLNATSSSFFSPTAISDLILYPRQSIFISFCVTVNAFCDGRANPTSSGSGIDFTNTLTANTNTGNNATSSITLTDFHSTEAVVSAGLYVPEFNNQSINPPGLANPDATYDYVNTVIITNEGSVAAQNVNFNMGLEDFRDRVIFTDFLVSQTSGPTVTVNPDYNGDDETMLLMPKNSLPAGETIVLEIYYEIGPLDEPSYSFFRQIGLSQTQGGADDFDETALGRQSAYTFVTWSDGLGDHLDRYYFANSSDASISSALYCECTTAGMRFVFNAASSTNKVISNVNEAPNGILEHEEITYQITIENISNAVQLDELQLTDNLNSTCNGKVLSVSTPIILNNSTATTNPNLNANYNGVSDTNLFDGASGLLMDGENLTVEFTVLYNETCIGSNTATFTSRDPLNRLVTSTNSASVYAFTDTDNDGINDDIDIDDDNDTIPDVLEYNGVNPIGDDDADFIPNYRDTDFGVDANADGIIDAFDFDNDGVPNHFDLDSDNDGILDIVEAGNADDDTNNNGSTNNSVGANGLDNTKENSDSINTSISYLLLNTDSTGSPNFIDIDADADGIVDNIEAQSSNSYTTINTSVSALGINTAYPNGLNPVDTENDGTPDYIDFNSDNDISDDVIEGWDVLSDGTPDVLPSNIDADNDGLDDAFDSNDNLVNPTNGQTPQSFPNADNADTPELDWREIMAIVVLINNVSGEEGTDIEYELLLARKKDNTELIESASDIDIRFSTSDGIATTTQYQVATTPFDYDAISNIDFTIPSGTNTAQFSVTSLEDIIFELDELFTLSGTITSSNTINATISGIGTIENDDDPPSIEMNDSREYEGVDLEHTITISHPSSRPIIIDVASNDNLAISPDDYTSISETLIIDGTIDENNANTEVSFSISSHLDNLNELEEEPLNVIGTVNSASVVGAQDLNKAATILDIDPNPLVEISNEETIEGVFFNFTISLLNADGDLMRNYLPINLTLETVDNTANGNLDFESLSNQVTIPAYFSAINQTVNTIDDRLNEETETFFLQANIFSTDVSNTFSPRGIGTIKDNDYPNLFSPNGDNRSDVFKVSGIEDFPNFKLTIFNRLGNEVYNYSNNGRVNPLWWDGTHNGKPVPTGVYYYILDFNDGITKPITNFIQLIR